MFIYEFFDQWRDRYIDSFTNDEREEIIAVGRGSYA